MKKITRSTPARPSAGQPRARSETHAAVDERMILGNAEGIVRSDRGKVRGRVVDGPVYGSPERGLEKTFVAHADAAAVLRELLLVDGKDDFAGEKHDFGHRSIISPAREARCGVAS